MSFQERQAILASAALDLATLTQSASAALDFLNTLASHKAQARALVAELDTSIAAKVAKVPRSN